MVHIPCTPNAVDSSWSVQSRVLCARSYAKTVKHKMKADRAECKYCDDSAQALGL